ncbi:hypothetical protein DOY81_012658 [Sarcophaga bullata]|nr:hypothetical protein DOY81_012658 [Sarcophaga bullata]
METKYKQELADCHKEIQMLRETNKDLQPQIEAVEIARKKDREETIQKLSEKSSLIDNMRAQIVKLEKQQMASFEFVDQISNKRSPDDFDKYYVPRGEHELKIKELERKLSELLASI